MPAIEHAYRDRWQTSLRDAWEADRDVRSDVSFSRLLALLEERDRDLEAHLRSTTSTTAWIAPTLLGTWANYSSPSFAGAEYRRVGDRVEIRGIVKSGTSGTAVFTLPVGFRPPAALIFPAMSDPNVFCRLDVEVDGDVVVYILAGGTNALATLNCSFSVVTT